MSVGAALGGGWRPDLVGEAASGGEGGRAPAPDLGWICDRYRSQAVGYAFAILHDHATAEDAVQLAFARIVARVAGGDGALLDGDPERVVIRNTRWAALELVQRQRRSEGLEAADQSAGVMELSGRIWERSQARQLCDQIAADLPTHYRDALRMRFVEQHHDADAASRLGITLKAYRCRLDRALREARESATRLGIDSLGGLVVVGRRAVVCRSTRLQAAVQDGASNLSGVSQAAIHGVLAIALAVGLVVLPLLAGGSSQGPAGHLPVPTGGVRAAYTSGPQVPSAGCDRCDRPLASPGPATAVTAYPSAPQGSSAGCGSCAGYPASSALTGGVLPVTLASTGASAIPASTGQVGSLVGSSQPQVRSVVGGMLSAGEGEAASAISTALVAVSPVGGSAAVPSLPAPSLP